MRGEHVKLKGYGLQKKRNSIYSNDGILQSSISRAASAALRRLTILRQVVSYSKDSLATMGSYLVTLASITSGLWAAAETLDLHTHPESLIPYAVGMFNFHTQAKCLIFIPRHNDWRWSPPFPYASGIYDFHTQAESLISILMRSTWFPWPGELITQAEWLIPYPGRVVDFHTHVDCLISHAGRVLDFHIQAEWFISIPKRTVWFYTQAKCLAECLIFMLQQRTRWFLLGRLLLLNFCYGLFAAGFQAVAHLVLTLMLRCC